MRLLRVLPVCHRSARVAFMYIGSLFVLGIEYSSFRTWSSYVFHQTQNFEILEPTTHAYVLARVDYHRAHFNFALGNLRPCGIPPGGPRHDLVAIPNGDDNNAPRQTPFVGPDRNRLGDFKILWGTSVSSFALAPVTHRMSFKFRPLAAFPMNPCASGMADLFPIFLSPPPKRSRGCCRSRQRPRPLTSPAGQLLLPSDFSTTSPARISESVGLWLMASWLLRSPASGAHVFGSATTM